MVKITDRARYYFEKHGWTNKDIEYAEEHSHTLHDEDGWAMFVAKDPEGVAWLYPTSEANRFPKGLWQTIKNYITTEVSVVIPISKNQELLRRAAKKYNGYLIDNALYVFSKEFEGLKIHEGEKKWHH